MQSLDVQQEDKPRRVTLRTIRKWAKKREAFAMLTCYDATTARWLWRGGVRAMLVGDTAAQVVLGHDSTLPAPMDLMVTLTRAVRRGAPEVFLMADMPYGSYQASADEAVANAMRFIKEGDADVVKLEVDATFAPLVERLTHCGVPVVVHLGSRPQNVRADGGYRAAGRTRSEASKLIDAAELMIQAGAAMLLVEAVPAEVSKMIVELAQNPPGRREIVPVIGCGAGNACHGHVVVLQDLLGMTDWQPPFAKPIAQVGRQVQEAAANWVQTVQSGQYLQDDHPYEMRE